MKILVIILNLGFFCLGAEDKPSINGVKTYQTQDQPNPDAREIRLDFQVTPDDVILDKYHRGFRSGLIGQILKIRGMADIFLRGNVVTIVRSSKTALDWSLIMPGVLKELADEFRIEFREKPPLPRKTRIDEVR